MDDTLRITTDALHWIMAEAEASADEICGLLLGDPAIARACRNVHPDPSRFFEVDPAALLRAHRQTRMGSRRVVGFYHSHPSGWAYPSIGDAEGAEPDGAIWLIVAGNQAGAWQAVADGPVHGRFKPLRLLMT